MFVRGVCNVREVFPSIFVEPSAHTENGTICHKSYFLNSLSSFLLTNFLPRVPLTLVTPQKSKDVNIKRAFCAFGVCKGSWVNVWPNQLSFALQQ